MDHPEIVGAAMPLMLRSAASPGFLGPDRRARV